jgi:hypothetical protein
MKPFLPWLPLRTVWCALALVLCGLAPLQAQALQMRGFRGLMWGDPPAHLGGATLEETAGPVRCYRREGDNLLFGDTELRAVRYCFHRDRLFRVVLEPLRGAAPLRAEFERGYGAPDQVGGGVAQWGGRADPLRAELDPGRAGTPPSLRLTARAFEPTP